MRIGVFSVAAVAAAIGGALLFSAPASADSGVQRLNSAPQAKSRYHGQMCAFYEHQNYQGQFFTLPANSGVRRLDGAWNDRISSFTEAPSCTVKFWRHPKKKGKRRGQPRGASTESANYGRNYGVPKLNRKDNDEITFVQCNCKGAIAEQQKADYAKAIVERRELPAPSCKPKYTIVNKSKTHGIYIEGIHPERGKNKGRMDLPLGWFSSHKLFVAPGKSTTLERKRKPIPNLGYWMHRAKIEYSTFKPRSGKTADGNKKNYKFVDDHQYTGYSAKNACAHGWTFEINAD